MFTVINSLNSTSYCW